MRKWLWVWFSVQSVSTVAGSNSVRPTFKLIVVSVSVTSQWIFSSIVCGYMAIYCEVHVNLNNFANYVVNVASVSRDVRFNGSFHCCINWSHIHNIQSNNVHHTNSTNKLIFMFSISFHLWAKEKSCVSFCVLLRWYEIPLHVDMQIATNANSEMKSFILAAPRCVCMCQCHSFGKMHSPLGLPAHIFADMRVLLRHLPANLC